MLRPIILLCFLSVSTALHAFSYLGHQAIAEIARENLTPEARSAIIAILGDDYLPAIAPWLDETRENIRKRKVPAEDVEFATRFPNSQRWHYLGFPVGSTEYSASSPFADRDDLVHAVDVCVGILEDPKSSQRLRVYAIKAIVHLIGDLHQPLHVVSGYYKVSTDGAFLRLAPSDASPRSTTDAGGNALFVSSGVNLHSYVDSLLPAARGGGASYDYLLNALRAHHVRVQKPAGGPEQWVAEWAKDGLAAGATIYSGISLAQPEFSGNRTKVTVRKVSIQVSPDLLHSLPSIIEDQMALAGYRLAFLLNHIDWERGRIVQSLR